MAARLIVSEFITLDGVFEDPGGGEEFELGGWAFQFERGPEGDKFKFDELMDAEAMLLGRKTYGGFAAFWPDREDEEGFAARMNGMPKYLVSTTLQRGDWNNTTVIDGNVPERVAEVKAQHDGEILIAGSGQLVQALMPHGLIDEYRLMVYPVVLGAGRRLFEDTGRVDLRLSSSLTAGQTQILTYHPA